MPHIIVSVGVMAKETIRFFIKVYSFPAWPKHENEVHLIVELRFFLKHGLGLQLLAK